MHACRCDITGVAACPAGKKPGRRQKKSGRDYLDDDDDVDFKRAANGSIIKRVVPRSSCVAAFLPYTECEAVPAALTGLDKYDRPQQ